MRLVLKLRELSLSTKQSHKIVPYQSLSKSSQLLVLMTEGTLDINDALLLAELDRRKIPTISRATDMEDSSLLVKIVHRIILFLIMPLKRL